MCVYCIVATPLLSNVHFSVQRNWPRKLRLAANKEIGRFFCFTGWGVFKRGEKNRAEKLREVQIPTVNQSTCANGNSFFKPVDNVSMLCAGFGGNSTVSGCNGDSGGPLVCKEGGKFVLRGAVSWGIPGCPAGETYSVFVRISSFVDWIEDNIKNIDKCTCIDQGMQFTSCWWLPIILLGFAYFFE